MGKFKKFSNMRFEAVLPVLLLFCFFYVVSAKRVIADTVHYGGGVQTFNGRTGAIMPQSGDYTPAQVGLGNVPNANPFDGSTTFSDIKTKGPWADVRAYGATCSATTETVTTTAGSGTVTVGAIGDFKVGQSVVIPLAGASDAPATPAGFTNAVLDGYKVNPHNLPPNPWWPTSNGNTRTGVCTTDSTASPYHNASCTTTYGYTLRAVGFDGALSAPSAVAYVNNGPATISYANHIYLSWNTDPNAIGYVINRCTGTSCTPNYNSIYKVLPNLPVGQTASGNFEFIDVGNQFGHGEYTLAGSAMAGILNTTITAISGTTVTLANAPSQSGTFTMYHDDEPAFEAAALAVSPMGPASEISGGEVLAPDCATPYNFGQPMSLVGLMGVTIEGQGSRYNNEGGTQINWLGPIGGIVFNGNHAARLIIKDIGVPSGSSNNTPGIVFDPDKYTGPAWNTYGPGGDPSGRTVNTTAWRLENVECGESGVCLEMGNPITNQNIENFEINNLYCDDPNGYGGWACIHGDSQETYNEYFNDISISNRDIGVNFNRVGSFDLKDANFEQNVLDVHPGIVSTNGRIEDCTTEWAQEFLTYPGATNLQVENCRLATSGLGPDGYLMYTRGHLLLENNTVDTGWGADNLALDTNNNAGYGTSVLINNKWYYGLTGGYPATPGNEPITDENGGQSIGGSYISIGDDVAGTMVPLAIVGASASGNTAEGITLVNARLRQQADAAPSASYKPSVSSCGTGSIANGTNMAMVITVGSGVTNSCAVTFNANQPFANAPTCTFQDVTQGITLKQASLTATGVVLNAPSGVADFENDTINGMCMGN
ncbi:MAG: hypothetical protein M0Z52_02060 [Actinomycetota bacterium]|nr:hypothetical protein [Actinomycetota bacterium]